MNDSTLPQFTRTHILVGDAGITRLKNMHIFIAGLGGWVPIVPKRWRAPA